MPENSNKAIVQFGVTAVFFPCLELAPYRVRNLLRGKNCGRFWPVELLSRVNPESPLEPGGRSVGHNFGGGDKTDGPSFLSRSSAFEKLLGGQSDPY